MTCHSGERGPWSRCGVCAGSHPQELARLADGPVLPLLGEGRRSSQNCSRLPRGGGNYWSLRNWEEGSAKAVSRGDAALAAVAFLRQCWGRLNGNLRRVDLCHSSSWLTRTGGAHHFLPEGPGGGQLERRVDPESD